MLRFGTVVAVRRPGQTALAADGKIHATGDVAYTGYLRRIHRLDGNTILASQMPWSELCAAIEPLRTALASKCSLREAALRLVAVSRPNKESTILASSDALILVTPRGDVIEPEDGVVALGDGAGYACAAAKALVLNTGLSAEAIARESLRIAAEFGGGDFHDPTIEVV